MSIVLDGNLAFRKCDECQALSRALCVGPPTTNASDGRTYPPVYGPALGWGARLRIGSAGEAEELDVCTMCMEETKETYDA